VNIIGGGGGIAAASSTIWRKYAHSFACCAQRASKHRENQVDQYGGHRMYIFAPHSAASLPRRAEMIDMVGANKHQT